MKSMIVYFIASAAFSLSASASYCLKSNCPSLWGLDEDAAYSIKSESCSSGFPAADELKVGDKLETGLFIFWILSNADSIYIF